MGLIVLFIKFLCEVLHIRNIELTKSSTKLDIAVHSIYGKKGRIYENVRKKNSIPLSS